MEWEDALETIAASGGTTLLIGGMDTGKTTFSRLLLNRCIEVDISKENRDVNNKENSADAEPNAADSGIRTQTRTATKKVDRVAVLDADLGQSEIGPPACVGLAFAGQPVLSLSDLQPALLAFVGSVTPHGWLLELVTAVRRLADSTPAGMPLIIDTGGYLQGASARRLIQTLCDLLAPAHIVALQRSTELTPFLPPLRRRGNCTLHLLPIPAAITHKTPRLRTQRRAMRFAAYFQNAVEHSYNFDEVAFGGTWLGTGTPLAAHLLKFAAQTLRSRGKVYYAERSDQHLGIMTSHPVPHDAPELGILLQELKAKSMTITSAPRLKHLLVGLETGGGKLLGLGSLSAVDFRRRTLGVLTPVRAPAAASILRFGSLRVAPDGSEVGTLAPNEIG